MTRHRTSLLGGLFILALSGCAKDAVVMIRNETTCSFEDVEGYKVHPRSGEEEIVFAFERIDPRDERPAYFILDWNGVLRIKATQPEDFVWDVEVKSGVKTMVLPLNPQGPLNCRLRSIEEY